MGVFWGRFLWICDFAGLLKIVAFAYYFNNIITYAVFDSQSLGIDEIFFVSLSQQTYTMKQLPYTSDNVTLISDFFDETRKRIAQGVEITFTKKANDELTVLALDFDIEIVDIEKAINNLSVENYYRGIDPSKSADFDGCAFCTVVGKSKVEIYLKYGLALLGLQILLFSNHVPDFPIAQTFKN
ncbi:MAG: hypothetical protein H7257_09500 [Taibaiella sp.]|nr:hypothetical protein [Taibaiella sp.]